jgi:hypothetical protein
VTDVYDDDEGGGGEIGIREVMEKFEDEVSDVSWYLSRLAGQYGEPDDLSAEQLQELRDIAATDDTMKAHLMGLAERLRSVATALDYYVDQHSDMITELTNDLNDYMWLD